jgi:hypothetical protein
MKISSLLPIIAAMVALALPVASQAKDNPPGNSGNTPAHDNAHGQPFQSDGGTAPVPEPAAWLSMGTLAAAAAVYARRQMKQRKEA